MNYPQFCYPLSWTCLIDWQALAAVFTLLAVGVSLWQSHSGMRLVLRQRELDRAETAARNHAEASRLALVLDHELFNYGGVLVTLMEEMTEEAVRKDPLASVDFVHRAFPTDPLPMLTRFAGQLGVFDAILGAHIMLVLGTFHSLRNNPSAEDLASAPKDMIRTGMASTALLFGKAVSQIRTARDGLKPLVEPFRKEWIDFGDHVQRVKDELEAHGKGGAAT